MPTDTGGDARDASQNQSTDVANRGRDGAQPQPKRAPQPTERETMLARLDEQIIAQRAEDDQRFLETGDPRAVMLAAEMGRESRGEAINTDRPRVANRPAPESGTVEPIVESDETRQEADAAAEAAREATQIGSDGADPLADYIVRQDGKPPQFRTVVDGQVRLIPLDKARAALQKHLAADIRLQQASQRQRQLDERERQIQQTEAALRTRQAQPTREAVAIDDAALERDAAEVVRSLVSAPEAEATQKLAKVLKTVRQAAAPQIDPNAIAAQAADVAVRKVAERDAQRALVDGLNGFVKAYPEIAADSDLYSLADSKTTAIATEHPDWTPEQVMMEAGRLVREKFGRPGPKPRQPGSGPSDAVRQQAKGKLTPMPQSRVGRPAPAADAEPDNSPQAAMADIRKARGQAY